MFHQKNSLTHETSISDPAHAMPGRGVHPLCRMHPDEYPSTQCQPHLNPYLHLHPYYQPNPYLRVSPYFCPYPFLHLHLYYRPSPYPHLKPYYHYTPSGRSHVLHRAFGMRSRPVLPSDKLCQHPVSAGLLHYRVHPGMRGPDRLWCRALRLCQWNMPYNPGARGHSSRAGDPENCG